MRFGINTFLFTSPFTNDSTPLFKDFKKWGFDSVELAIEDPSHIDPRHVRAELDRYGLVCGTVCGAFGPDRDLRGTPEAQQGSIDYVTGLMDQMAVLGCPTLAGPIYSAVGRAEAVPDKERKAQWKLVVKHLKKLCKYAEKKGITLAIEPLNRFETDFINTCEQALEMIRDVGSPALKIHLDTFHMNIEEKNLPHAVLKAGRLLAHFHASGSDRGAPGNDHIDWIGIGKALHKIKYQGDVVIESFTPDVKVIAKAASIWRMMEPSRTDIASKGVKFLKRVFG
ncbi:MAG TPA: sugar phosphate isomerase/epimerase family protein [Candidatus Paceibacterota bacterium]|nr:sugar phosphate isomerase/epimerase family protein [Verrucomicrobiota bacterium]HRZ43719.1 sugar phosphate isomerase/epimerase family protein [Candidatus Paceibacterota bacterium]HRZ93619.1 sugar phosphate isomerase/epimerase family protein [Candidatus Paceibacterota bacterium]